MPHTYSPLRYPGGKAAINGLLTKILHSNKLLECDYVEPYVGGAGLALSLLLDEKVKRLYLNDIDSSISDFWRVVLHHQDELITKIKKTDITVDEWQKQKAINAETDASIIDSAFSTLFLNRTNYSGILKGGIIGGKHQSGRYKIDSRFNKEGLIEKIQRISEYKDYIHIYNMDAFDFIEKMESQLPEKSFYYIDPPYFKKGKTLYTNFYNLADHEKIGRLLYTLNHHWVLTYDNVDEVRQLYKNQPIHLFDLHYSANRKRMGSECLLHSKNLLVEATLFLSKAS